MSNPWKLDQFPERIPHDGLPDKVQAAYTAWLQTRAVNPKRGAYRLQGDDERYTAEVPDACYRDHRGGWKLMCDYDVYEPNLSQSGRAVFVDMGFVEGDGLGE